jgi:outer membrane protein
MGRLTTQALGLDPLGYDPSIHFEQVRDLWGGTETPDAGR